MSLQTEVQDPVGVSFHRLTQLYPPPDFVKTASAEQLSADRESLPDTVYGDPVRKLYPCHTAAATWRSMGLFQEQRAGMHKAAAAEIERRIVNAASFFGVHTAVTELRDKMAAADQGVQQDLPDSTFALVWVDDENKKHRHYPLRNPAEVKTAADWFGQYRDEVVFEDRRTLATRILAKVDELNVPLEDRSVLEKCAGHGLCAGIDVIDALQKRVILATHTHAKQARALQQLATDIAVNPAIMRPAAFRDKLASVMDQFDRETHLSRMYQDGLERPEDVLFELPVKLAAEAGEAHVVTINGPVYEKEALARLELHTIRDWMGDEFAAAVTTDGFYPDAQKLAEVVPTLPRGDADIFERMTEAVDIHPVGYDKGASTELSAAELARLAQDYAPAASP